MSGVQWSNEDDSRLLANAHNFTAKELAVLLGRTEYAVECRLHTLHKPLPVMRNKPGQYADKDVAK